MPNWKAPVTAPEVFEAMADGEEAVAPVQAALFRCCAADPLALSLLPEDPTWDMSHRLLAGARWLVSSGDVDDFEGAEDPWHSFRALLEEHGEWLARFVIEHRVQTNEVQRLLGASADPRWGAPDRRAHERPRRVARMDG